MAKKRFIKIINLLLFCCCCCCWDEANEKRNKNAEKMHNFFVGRLEII